MAVDKTLKRYGGDGQTLHGLGSTLRDWCGETTNFDRETVELALSHRIGDAAKQAYRRSAALDKRRVLMRAWALCALSTNEATNPCLVKVTLSFRSFGRALVAKHALENGVSDRWQMHRKLPTFQRRTQWQDKQATRKEPTTRG
ncbi:MAG: hypothetical protein ABJK39_09905 [Hyphomicrobiales bacterium]